MTPRARITLLALLPVLAGFVAAPAWAAPATALRRPTGAVESPPAAPSAATGAAAAARAAQSAARATTLSPPVAVKYGGSADALSVTTTGAGRAIYGRINKGSNAKSAIVGATNGLGAGIAGSNTGSGPAGRLDIAAAGNSQPALLATTKGTGAAISGTVERATGVDSAGVSGRNNLTSGYGYGGDFRGGFVGVYAAATNGYGLYATAPASSGYAGYFSGNVYIAGNLTYTSDRAVKANARDIDRAEVLDRVARLPLQSWALREQPDVRHVGPYAQDFHAAFGLGSDDVSISPVDVSGVTLAAVQELHRLVRRQDEEISALRAQLATLVATAGR